MREKLIIIPWILMGLWQLNIAWRLMFSNIREEVCRNVYARVISLGACWLDEEQLALIGLLMLLICISFGVKFKEVSMISNITLYIIYLISIWCGDEGSGIILFLLLVVLNQIKPRESSMILPGNPQKVNDIVICITIGFSAVITLISTISHGLSISTTVTLPLVAIFLWIYRSEIKRRKTYYPMRGQGSWCAH